jgi:hypothetical protein
MNDDKPPKKSFWELWVAQSGQRAIASIMALGLGFALVILSITAGVALLMQRLELSGTIADMFKTVLSAIVGALSVYVGMKGGKNSE